MVDRVALLQDVSEYVELPATKGAQYKKALEKALSISLSELPLEDARRLNGEAKAELARTLDQLMTLADLKKVSKKWEPKRTVSSGFTQSEIVDALDELLQGRREPYARPQLTLAHARALSASQTNDLEDLITRLMPKAELKALLKKWDKQFKPAASFTVPQYRDRLLALLHGEREPEPKPAPKSKSRK